MTDELHVGDSLPSFERVMTSDRMKWYADVLALTAEPRGAKSESLPEKGRFEIESKNIHTDDEYARQEGMRGIIADGMVSTNWISDLLYAKFGVDYIKNGSLRTKYIKPIYEDQVVSVHIVVDSLVAGVDGTRYGFDVWCETADGKCTVGRAAVTVTKDGSGITSAVK